MSYPLVICINLLHSEVENGVEIVDLPMKNGWIFQGYLSLPEGIKRNIKWAIESLLNLLEIVDTAIECTLSLFPLRQINICIYIYTTCLD